MTESEINKLVLEVIAKLERDNWQDRQMTANERAAVSLAVRHTVKLLCEKRQIV